LASGLFALLDDVAGIAKIAASSVDDVVAQAGKAGAKAAGVVIDDAAVTPRYAVGFAAARELPIIWRIAMGSLRNKLLILLPGALVLALIAPWAITPLLMAGGVFLCFEGAEKLLELALPHGAHGDGKAGETTGDPAALEQQKIAGAVKTDFILSAEIMAITLAGVADQSFWMKASVLAIVGIGITVVVYGVVALIVKADDAGMALAANQRPAASLLGLRRLETGEAGALDRALSWLTQPFGRGLVVAMPHFLNLLGVVGTAAMLWVGGGIIIHGLEEYGLSGLGHGVHDLAVAAGRLLPAALASAGEWLAGAGLAAVFGVIVGGLTIVAMHWLVGPVVKLFRKDAAAQTGA
jgi:predicted DNA repair protein MutK